MCIYIYIYIYARWEPPRLEVLLGEGLHGLDSGDRLLGAGVRVGQRVLPALRVRVEPVRVEPVQVGDRRDHGAGEQGEPRGAHEHVAPDAEHPHQGLDGEAEDEGDVLGHLHGVRREAGHEGARGLRVEEGHLLRVAKETKRIKTQKM